MVTVETEDQHGNRVQHEYATGVRIETGGWLNVYDKESNQVGAVPQHRVVAAIVVVEA